MVYRNFKNISVRYVFIWIYHINRIKSIWYATGALGLYLCNLYGERNGLKWKL